MMVHGDIPSKNIHNIRTLTIRPEFQAVSDKEKNELTEMGLDFQY